MPKASSIVILAEDRAHQRFAERYLKQRGYTTHEIRPVPLPSAKGCGEQWARQHYAREVKACRRRSLGKKAATALIVVIDADTGDVSRRLKQLEEVLMGEGEAQRDAAERIVHWIPKRNIETWILCLNGETVDELTDYKRRSNLDIKSAAGMLFDWSRPNAVLPVACIPSLRLAISEVRRLD